jgi:hypothetical protein
MIFMHSTEAGLVLFFASFLFILWYALTRSRGELDGWSRLPLTNRADDPAAENGRRNRSDAHE